MAGTTIGPTRPITRFRIDRLVHTLLLFQSTLLLKDIKNTKTQKDM